MPVIVQKFGGSSVADVDKIKAIAKKIVATKQEGNEVVVVVSAMGKTTDGLLKLAREVTEKDPPRRELDMLVSTGERVTMALLSMAVQELGYDAISFTGSQSGIITNDRHFDAKIIDVRPHRVEDELTRGKIVIIAGYQGMSYKREITTLGRGGSDTTAIAMAAALGADHAEIYSDVDGVYSADPRVVQGAEHLPEVSYDDMLEMSLAGAKVLHSKAVEFAKSAGIAIVALSTFGEGGRSTIIHRDAAPTAGAIVGRAGWLELAFEEEAPPRLLAFLRERGRGVQIQAQGTRLRAEISAEELRALDITIPARAMGRVLALADPDTLHALTPAFKAAGIAILDLQIEAQRGIYFVEEAQLDEAVNLAHACARSSKADP